MISESLKSANLDLEYTSFKKDTRFLNPNSINKFIQKAKYASQPHFEIQNSNRHNVSRGLQQETDVIVD